MPELNIKLIIDGKEANATLNLTKEQLAEIASTASKAGQTTTSSLGNIGSIVTGLNQGLELAKKGFEILSKPLNLSMDAEQAQISFEVLLGSAQKAREMVAGLKDDATRTPYEFTDLQQATKVLLNFGIEGEKVRGILSMLGDVSSGDAQKMQQLSLVFGQVASAGKLQGQDLLQLINAGFNPLQEISRTTGKSMADLRKEMEKGGITYAMVEDAFKSITSEGGRFYQMMDKQSQSGKGLLSTLSDIGNQVVTLVGNEMMPFIKETTKALSEVGSSLLPVENNFDKASMAGTTLSTRFNELSFNIERLGSKTSRTADEEKIFQESLDSMQKEYPNYFKSLDIHKTKYNDLVTAIGNAKIELDKYIESMISAALVQDKMSEITDLGRKKYEATKSKLEAERKYNEADSNGTLDKEDPQLKKDALLTGNRLLKVETTRDILNAQAISAENTIKETTVKIASLRTEIEGLKNSASGIIPPGNEGKSTQTSTATEKKDPFAKAKERELEDIKKANEKIELEQSLHSKELMDIEEALLKEKENLNVIEENIKNVKTQEDLDKLKFERDLSLQRISVLEAESKEKIEIFSKEYDAWEKTRNDQLKAQEEYLKKEKELAAEEGQIRADSLKTDAERQLARLDIWYNEENQKFAGHNEAKLLLDKAYAQKRHDILKQTFAESHPYINMEMEAVVSGFREGWSQLVMVQRQAKDGMDAVWLAIENSALQAIGNIVARYIENLIIEKVIGETFRAAEIASAVATGAAIASAYAPAAAFASIMSFGGASLAGSAGLAATTALAYSLALPKFEQGGLPQGRNAIIQVNEKGQEFVVNHEATKRNLPLLQLINSGVDLRSRSLADIYNTSLNAGSGISIVGTQGSDQALILEIQNMSKSLDKYAKLKTKAYIGEREYRKAHLETQRFLNSETT